ncbi:hypothetical protein ACFLY2_03040 [Patescibacteria group bacterium]
MKKLVLASIAALAIAAATLSASTQTTDPYGFAPAKTSIGYSSVTVAYVDTSQKAVLFTSIQKSKINNTSTETHDKKVLVKLSEHDGDIFIPLMAHRFGPDSIKTATNSDYGRDKFEVRRISSKVGTV